MGRRRVVLLGIALPRALLPSALILAALPGVAVGAETGGQPAPAAGAQPAPAAGAQPAPAAQPSPAPQRFAVGIRVVRIVDRSRTIRLSHGRSERRVLPTYVLYPALGEPGSGAQPQAPPASAAAPFPLVVFAHGFDVTPLLYMRLLESWAAAGYLVAAPVFPLTSPRTPGGPVESDVVNQPRDVSFVISSLLAQSAAAGSPLAGLIDGSRIAVAGQSDGGETALAVAYGRRMRDPRVDAAVVLSGAEMSGVGGYGFVADAPPLLAVQGTADTSNEPRFTYAYFDAARRPKYLLRLIGAGHLPPYTSEQPQLGIVERVTGAFLDGYLRRVPAQLEALATLGTVPRFAALTAQP
jgi:fermentation-respiration switch protein FrsA (DUF1100 family)